MPEEFMVWSPCCGCMLPVSLEDVLMVADMYNKGHMPLVGFGSMLVTIMDLMLHG